MSSLCYQLFIVDHYSRLHLHCAYSNTISIVDLIDQYHIPSNAYLSYNNHVLYNTIDSLQYNHSTLHVQCRLFGGKGGFGSLLRSTGRKNKSQKQDTGAMRDLSGRRLRTVQQEQLINNTSSSNNNITIQQLQLQYHAINNGLIAESQKKPCRHGDLCKYQYKCRYSHPNNNISSTVHNSTNSITHSSNSNYDDDGDSDDESLSDTEYKSQLRNALMNSISTTKKQKLTHTTSSSTSTTSNSTSTSHSGTNGIDNVRNTTDSAYYNTINSILYESNHVKSCYSDSDSDNYSIDIDESELSDYDDDTKHQRPTDTPYNRTNNTDNHDEYYDPVKDTYMTNTQQHRHNSNNFLDIPDYKPPTDDNNNKQIESTIDTVHPSYTPIDLSKHSTAVELEQYGLDHLKYELQRNRMKCGGTLSQRANRLFLLKHDRYDELPDKVKAN